MHAALITAALLAGLAPTTSAAAPGAAAPGAAATSASRFLIGDSLGVSVSAALATHDFGVDAEVGRQFSAAEGIVRAARNGLPRNVVVELGTNGTIALGDCQSVVRAATKQRRVFLVTSRVPRSWEQPNLDTLGECNRSFAKPRVRVINWYKRSARHPGWFAADQVHLSTAGQGAFVRLIVKAVTRKGLA